MPTIFETLSEAAQIILLSDAYRNFLANAAQSFGLTDEQKKVLDDIVWNLFRTKGRALATLVSDLQNSLSLSQEDAQALARQIMINAVLVFPDYFGDQTVFYKTLGGIDVEQDLYESFVYNELLKGAFDGVLRYMEGALDVDPEQEMRDMRQLFARNFIELLYVNDDEFIRKLNNTLFILLGTVENCSIQLLRALDENHQWVGAEKILLDGKEAEPTAANWVKSFLGEMNGEVSTISIPKYLSLSKNTKNLVELDRNALVKLLETFRVLHNFPRSFENLDPEQWMVIPYRQEEKPLASATRPRQDFSVAGAPAQPTQAIDTLNANRSTLNPISSTSNSLNTNHSTLNPSSHMLIDNDILSLADTIIKDTGVNALNWERFRKLLASYLKGLRNDLDTKDRLQASDGEGGIGLSQDDSDKVMKKARETYIMKHEAQNMKQKEKQQNKNSVSGFKFQVSGTRDSFGRSRLKQGDSNIKSQIPNDKSQIAESLTAKPLPLNAVPSNLPVVSEEKPLLVIEDVDGLPMLINKTVDSSQQQVVSIKSKIPNNKSLASAKAPAQPPASATRLRQDSGVAGAPAQQIQTDQLNAQRSTLTAISSGIPLKVNVGLPHSPQKDSSSIAGVKRPAVLDMVEELRAMTLQDFRRLSQDPKEAVQKIYQKIMLLEKESFTKKTAGLESWRDNEVNQLYFQMGRESFGKGVSMKEVIEERKKAGKDFLVEPEFDALLELNGLLRS